MTFWSTLPRLFLVLAILLGSVPQMAVAEDQATAVHAAMMSMPQSDMASDMDKSRIDYCKRHCLAVVAVLPEMQAPIFEARRIAQLQPHVDLVRVSITIAPTGPPPKALAS